VLGIRTGMMFVSFEIDAGKAYQQRRYKQGTSYPGETEGTKDDGDRKAVSYSRS
jgi:hypothetical protein